MTGNAETSEWRDSLEFTFCNGVGPDDDIDDTVPEVPLRFRDTLKEFEYFFQKWNISTNQFIDALIEMSTNNFVRVWNEEEKEHISGCALWKLSEIDYPAVTNFFRRVNEAEFSNIPWISTISMFAYTNLEPEVLEYIKTQCLKTNKYDNAIGTTMLYMMKTLDSMDSNLKLSATNRVANYIYFAIHHTSCLQTYQDEELASFLPIYSNSIQRLNAMRHVSYTATNAYDRITASNEVIRLLSIPSNQLNNVTWLTAD